MTVARLLPALFLLCVEVAAQQRNWQRLDANGRVVLDLSGERDVHKVVERHGLVVVQYRGGDRRIILLDGTWIPGRFKQAWFRESLVDAKDASGQRYLFDREGRDVLAVLRAAGLKKPWPLGAGLFRAKDEKRGTGIYRHDGKRAVEFDWIMSRRGSVGSFKNGLATSRIGWLWGVVDDRGRVVVPPMYESLKLDGGGAIVRRHGNTFRIDLSNRRLDGEVASLEIAKDVRIVARRTGDDVALFRNDRRLVNGLREVRLREGVEFAAVVTPTSAGLVDFDGRWLVDPATSGMTDAWIDEEGLGVLSDGKGRMAFRDGKGADFASVLYRNVSGLRIHRYLGRGFVLATKDGAADEFYLLSSGGGVFERLASGDVGRFSKDGVCPVRDGERWGAIDDLGATAFAPRFETLLTTLDGRLVATDGDASFYVDAKGQRLDNTTARVVYGDSRLLNPWAGGSDRRYALSTQRRVATREYDFMETETGAPFVFVGVCGARGVVDRKGRPVIPLRFDHRACGVHVDGRAWVVTADGKLIVLEDDRGDIAAGFRGTAERYVGQRVVVDPEGAYWTLDNVRTDRPRHPRPPVVEPPGPGADLRVVERKRKDGGRRSGVADASGRLILPHLYRYVKLGDPWIRVSMWATTIWRQERFVSGYIDRNGTVRVAPAFWRAEPYRNGHAWVVRSKVGRSEDEQFDKFPREWFTENRTAFRAGSEVRGTRSVQTSGKYAVLHSGFFEGGKLHGLGQIVDLERGQTIGVFEQGKLVKHLMFIARDGRNLSGPLKGGVLHGKGKAYRTDQTVEFEGEWRDGRKWSGTGYVKGEPTLREVWEGGKLVGKRTVERPPVKPKPRAGAVACLVCAGRGVVWMDDYFQRVPGTSLVLTRGRYNPHMKDGWCDCDACEGAGYP
jgi:hypothetical protein